jgi:hypothetical protein
MRLSEVSRSSRSSVIARAAYTSCDAPETPHETLATERHRTPREPLTMEMDALAEALGTLRAADELRRALPYGSRDRLALEAEIAALDAEIHHAVASEENPALTDGVRAVSRALRRRIADTNVA